MLLICINYDPQYVQNSTRLVKFVFCKQRFRFKIFLLISLFRCQYNVFVDIPQIYQLDISRISVEQNVKLKLRFFDLYNVQLILFNHTLIKPIETSLQAGLCLAVPHHQSLRKDIYILLLEKVLKEIIFMIVSTQLYDKRQTKCCKRIVIQNFQAQQLLIHSIKSLRFLQMSFCFTIQSNNMHIATSYTRKCNNL